MIGKTLAHYRIVEKIGAGGMGEVYRATDTKLGRDVALKMLPPAFAQDAERMARLQREAQVLASLNHPNIGAIYGLEEAEQARVLVLELVEGPTLFDRLLRGRVPVDEALAIARQIAEAVEYAHEKGVVHRDLKPANVKVTDDDRVKVLDFGLAKALETPADASGDAAQSPTLSPTLQSPITGALTGANVILGTAAYMSPEQARGKVVDKRSDIWSFGVILFEMLTGRRLFNGETVSDTLAAVLRKEPEWDALPESTPSRIRRLLRRCLERDTRKRLRDIGEARVALAQALEGHGDETAESTGAAPAGTRRPAHPWLAAALLVVGLAGGATLGWLLKPGPPGSVVRRFFIPSHVAEQIPRAPSISPDGRHIAYVLDNRLWIRALDRIEPRVVDRSEGAHSPFWSPDGSTIGFDAQDRLWKIGIDESRPTLICDLDKGMREASWNESDEIAFVQGRKLMRVSARGGDVETVRELGSEEATDLHGVDHLPGGRGWVVAVHGADEQMSLEVWTRDERKSVLQIAAGAQWWTPRWVEPGYVLYERSGSTPGIWALPFSLSKLEATGDPFLVLPGASNPSVSRDGTLVATPRRENTDVQLVWVGLDGSIGGSIGQPQEGMWSPALSPDASRIVVSGLEGGNRDLWIHDVERSTKTRLTFTDDTEERPSWSPDGHTIYFSWPPDRDTKIWEVPEDGSGEPRELTAGGWLSLSADGAWMAFERRDEKTGIDLWRWSLGAGGEPEVFLRTDAKEENARLSPDGKWLAYESDESGRDEIYVKPFPSGSGKWQVSINSGQYAQWSPESDRLFFVDDEDVLQEVEVRTGAGLRLSTPKPVVDGRKLHLFPRQGYCVAPGGDRLIVVHRVEEEGEKESEKEREVRGILVVENWLSEFR